VVHLPTYSPDLNPAEGIWSMLKASLTNYAATNLNHLARAVKRRLKMTQYQSRLVDGCLTQTSLIMKPV
jgi:transposase